MNEMQIFNNDRFGEVRTIEDGDRILFVASDVARALGYQNTSEAIRYHCRGVAKRYITDSLGRSQEANVIPEGDIYRLAAKSELPGAEEFERWIFDEVLPAIRKHGLYATPTKIDDIINDPDSFIRVLTALKEERAAKARLQLEAAENKPKVIFSDAVAVSASTILIGELAKIIKQNGIKNMGEKRLFDLLREKGYLIRRRGTDYNAPTQKAMELDLFKVKETALTHSDGHVTISKTTKVTGKGQQYFINKFLTGELYI